MYINRGLILVFLTMYIFIPVFQDWIGDNQLAWYRPFVVWLLIIGLTYWVQRKKKNETLV